MSRQMFESLRHAHQAIEALTKRVEALEAAATEPERSQIQMLPPDQNAAMNIKLSLGGKGAQRG